MKPEETTDHLKNIGENAKKVINDVKDATSLEDARVRLLGRKSELTSILRSLKDFTLEEKRQFGKAAQEMRADIENWLSEKEQEVGGGASVSGIDVTEPGVLHPTGTLHPNTQVQYFLEDAFKRLGFMVVDGPQVESDFYNFTAVNTPENHPARDMQDTFWLKDGHLLRTQTSNTQVRALREHGAPLRAIVPGRVFRYEAVDSTHDNTFYQLEGIMVDEDISIANLIATMKELLASILPNQEIKIRLRPGYFPFVEPGFELDIWTDLFSKNGKREYRWLELLPCGMIHPEVLRNGGVDPEKYSGFAFGLGLTRLVMLRFGIDDIRLLQGGDLRFLKQFSAR